MAEETAARQRRASRARRLAAATAGVMLSTVLLWGCADGDGSANGNGSSIPPTSSPPPTNTEWGTPTPPLTTSESPVPPTTTLPVGSVPKELVGAWCGGSDASLPHDTWIFEEDGTFTSDETLPLSGVAQVQDGETLVLHTNEIGIHERAIAMDRDTLIGDILYLDGYSYVRGEC